MWYICVSFGYVALRRSSTPASASLAPLCADATQCVDTKPEVNSNSYLYDSRVSTARVHVTPGVTIVLS